MKDDVFGAERSIVEMGYPVNCAERFATPRTGEIKQATQDNALIGGDWERKGFQVLPATKKRVLATDLSRTID